MKENRKVNLVKDATESATNKYSKLLPPASSKKPVNHQSYYL